MAGSVGTDNITELSSVDLKVPGSNHQELPALHPDLNLERTG